VYIRAAAAAAADWGRGAVKRLSKGSRVGGGGGGFIVGSKFIWIAAAALAAAAAAAAAAASRALAAAHAALGKKRVDDLWVTCDV
jgi:hypothetical protein